MHLFLSTKCRTCIRKLNYNTGLYAVCNAYIRLAETESKIFFVYNQSRYQCAETMEAQKENNKEVLEKEHVAPYTYFLQIKGKRNCVKAFMSFNHWLQIPREKLTPIRDMLDMLYVSCSMCDDIQDDTKVRGVLPAVHCIYGIPLTMNAAIIVLLLVLEKASNLSSEACKVVIEEYLAVYCGQGTEIYWRDNFICPTEEQFRKMIEQKTGRFFMIPVRLMQLFSEIKTDYSKLAFLLGTYFQVVDDYCNLNYQQALEASPIKEDNKVYDDIRFCEDITEGKFTLPIIHAMQSTYGQQILNILRQRTRDVNSKKYCLSLLEKAGSLQYTRDVMAKLDREVRAEMARLGGNPEMETVLDQYSTLQV